jgi:ATP-dependent Clp protease ATP-binding subunit ClpX
MILLENNMLNNRFTESDLTQMLPNPKETVKKLDEYIIGNRKTKETLALMIFRRGLRLLQLTEEFSCESPLEKNNILLIGNTGTGKTAIIKALAEIIQIPIPIIDLTTYTSKGWSGDDLEQALKVYIKSWNSWSETTPVLSDIPEDTQSDMVKKCAEYGIIYFDEIDKIKSHDTNNSAGRDISGTCVQQELLQYFESGLLSIDKKYFIDTTNLTCIAGGAFVGLKEIILKRIQKQDQIGFTGKLKQTNENKKVLEECTTEDLVNYGFIPELLGRVQHICALQSTSKEILLKMLLESKSSPLRQYEQLFDKIGIKVSIEKTGLNKIVNKAFALGTGGRALKGLIHNTFDEYLYNFYDLDLKQNLKISAKDIKA